MRDASRFKPSALIFPAFMFGLLLLAWLGRHSLFAAFASLASLKAAVDGAGAWGPVLFVGLQILQVLVFVIPGELVQIAGGVVFGPWTGSALSVVGIGLGSLAAFAAARLLGGGFVRALFGEETLARLDALVRSPKAQIGFFLLFLVPGIPKDALCFVAGLSTLRPLGFLAISMTARLPGIVGSAWMGAAAGSGRMGVFFGIAALAAGLFALGLLFRERLHELAARLSRRGAGEAIDEKTEAGKGRD